MNNIKTIDLWNLEDDSKYNLKYIKLIEHYKNFYKKFIENNEELEEQLSLYKMNLYSLVNHFLFTRETTIHISWNKLIKSINKYGFQKFIKNDDKIITSELSKIILDLNPELVSDFNEIIDNIKALDKIICKSPPTNTDLVVFRAMKDINIDYFECTKDGLYYTFNNYLSTTLSKTFAIEFMYRYNHNSLLTIIIPKNVNGIIFHKSYSNYIEKEYEFLLLRNSKFKLISTEIIKPKFELTTDIPLDELNNKKCNRNRTFKHYTLKLVSQPSYADLKSDYKLFKERINFSFNYMPSFTNLINEIEIEHKK